MSKYESTGSMAAVVARYSEIEGLQDQIKEHLDAIEALFAQIQGVATNGKVTERSVAKRTKPTGGRKGRAPRGALKAAIHKILAGGKSMKPADVVKALPGAGFKSNSKPRILYTTTYLAMKKDKAIVKTKDGFALKAPAKAKK